MFALAGIADGAGKAERIYALEEKLARTHWSRIESRDSDKTYNVWQTSEFAGKASGFDWARFFTGLAVENRPNFVVRQPGALTAFAAIAHNVYRYAEIVNVRLGDGQLRKGQVLEICGKRAVVQVRTTIA